MSETQVPVVHESLDNTPAHAVVDAEAAKVVAAQEKELEQKEKVVEEAKKSQDTDRFAQKFAALSRKEKAMRAREAQIAAREKEIEDRFLKLEEEARSKYIDPAELKKDALKTITEKGNVSIEELAELILNDGKKTPESIAAQVKNELQQQIEELKKQLSEKEIKEQEERLQQVTDNFKKELQNFVNNTEDYEMIRANDAYDLVYETIEAYYNETLDETGQNGKILSNKEAADLVEAELLEQARTVYQKANKKLSQVLKPKEEPASEQSSAQKVQSPTLSNAMSAAASKSAGRKLSDEESKAEVAKLLRWED
jgi:hypothetical protein